MSIPTLKEKQIISTNMTKKEKKIINSYDDIIENDALHHKLGCMRSM
jgi:hypothetical protein